MDNIAEIILKIFVGVFKSIELFFFWRDNLSGKVDYLRLFGGCLISIVLFAVFFALVFGIFILVKHLFVLYFP